MFRLVWMLRYAPPFRIAASTVSIVLPVLMQFTTPPPGQVVEVNVPVTVVLPAVVPGVGVVSGTVTPAVFPAVARWMCIPVNVIGDAVVLNCVRRCS